MAIREVYAVSVPIGEKSARGRGFLAALTLLTAAFLQSALPAASQPNETRPSTPAVATTSHALTAEDYPAESLRLAEQGTVGVRFVIGDTGDVTECAMTISSGKPRLDDAACAVVRKWKYMPATRDGMPVAVPSTANIVFQLRRNPGPYEDGVTAAQRGDFQAALMAWRPLADSGVPHAQAALGSLYLEGQGVPQDLEEGARWFRLAAEQRFAPAQTMMGQLYAGGRGVPRDFVEAAKWFENAARQGDARGQRFLGVLYRAGQGVPRDAAKAMEWFRMAAAQQDPEAQFELGLLYKAGDGVSQNAEEAANWFRLSAEQGNARAQSALGEAHASGSGVTQDPIESVRLYRLAAEQNNAVGQVQLARAYLEGKGIAENPVKALMWFWLASAAPITDEATRIARSVGENRRNDLRSRMSPTQAGEAMRMAATCSLSKFKDCDGNVQTNVPMVPPVALGSQIVAAEDYPQVSIRLQEQGTVGIRFIVAVDGTVRDCVVSLPSGRPRLDEAACVMVTRRWRYSPGLENGTPVESTQDAYVVFELR